MSKLPIHVSACDTFKQKVRQSMTRTTVQSQVKMPERNKHAHELMRMFLAAFLQKHPNCMLVHVIAVTLTWSSFGEVWANKFRSVETS